MPTEEKSAREIIDELLAKSGWVIQERKPLNLSVARGIVLRGIRLAQGRYDYLLLIDRNPVGVIKVKKAADSTAAEPSDGSDENLPDFLAQLFPGGVAKLPFHYEATGTELHFRDERELHPQMRPIAAFHRPETLAQQLAEP